MSDEQTAPPGAPDLAEILADLEADGVHVDESAEQWISPADVAALEEQVADAPEPIFVVLVAPPPEASSGWGDDLAFRLHDAGGPDGLYLGIDYVHDDYLVVTKGGTQVQPYAGDDSFRVSSQQWGEVAGSDDVGFEVDTILGYGDGGSAYELGPGLVTVTSALADGSFTEVATQARAEQRTTLDDERTSGATTTLLVVAVVVVLLAALATLVVRRLRARRPARGPQPFTLPDSVLERVREAGDADAVRRARAAVLALGERIDAGEIDPAAGPRADASWQAALDHYEAATRLLPDATRDGVEQPDVLDAVGALVLAERGEVALDAAARGATFEPPRPCFLNPLHGAAVDPRPLEVDGRRVDAPVCRTCRRDLEADRRPDVLDVRHGGAAAHYFETDREPWASTGFGALDADLLTRLRERSR